MQKVLIVDDDGFLLKMYKKKFELSGYEVLTAQDGQACLGQLGQVKPDLILLDIMMPKLSGLEVLEVIKKDEKLKTIPVIVLTNLTTVDDAEIAMSKGAAKFIVKSEYTPAEIVKEAEAVLKKS